MRRQLEHGLQCQQQYDASRQRGIMMEKFKSDLQTSLDYCIVCNCLVFADKVKIIHDCVLNEVSQLNNVQFYSTCITGLVKLCSKCNTQITKQQWPS